MKTQRLTTSSGMLNCIKFSHLSVFMLFTLLSAQLLAFEVNHKVVTSRKPASAFDEEVLTIPLEKRDIGQALFAEDDAGVMREMRDSLNSWQAKEEYAKSWNLKSTNLYNTPSTSDKRKFIAKIFFVMLIKD